MSVLILVLARQLLLYICPQNIPPFPLWATKIFSAFVSVSKQKCLCATHCVSTKNTVGRSLSSVRTGARAVGSPGRQAASRLLHGPIEGGGERDVVRSAHSAVEMHH